MAQGSVLGIGESESIKTLAMTTNRLPDVLFEELIAAVGRENVTIDAQQVDIVSRTCIPYRQIPRCRSISNRRCAGASRDFDWRAEHDVPVWPVSTGKNWGYGEKTACFPGGITMVLDHMTRIWEVNRS